MLIEITQQGEMWILRCEGRFPTGTDAEYLRVKRDAIKNLSCKKLLVDFREVTEIGSQGVGFLEAIAQPSVRQS